MSEKMPRLVIRESADEFDFDAVNDVTGAEFDSAATPKVVENPINKKVSETYPGSEDIGLESFNNKRLDEEILSGLIKARETQNNPTDFADEKQLVEAIKNLTIFSDVRNLFDQNRPDSLPSDDLFLGVTSQEKQIAIENLSIQGRKVEVEVLVGYGKKHLDLYCKNVVIK